MVEQSPAIGTQPNPGGRTFPFEQTGLGTEVFLQRMVDACASNLAVLDETGTILYASRAWLLSSEQHALAAKTDGLGLKHLATQAGSAAVPPEMAALAADIQRTLDNAKNSQRTPAGVPGGSIGFSFMLLP